MSSNQLLKVTPKRNIGIPCSILDRFRENQTLKSLVKTLNI